MTSASRQLEELATFVHGALATLHLLAAAYHLRRQHRLEGVLHLAAATYDVVSAQRHLRRARR